MEAYCNSLLLRLKENFHLNSKTEDFRQRHINSAEIIGNVEKELTDYLSKQSLTEHQDIFLTKNVKSEIESYKVEEELFYRIMLSMPIGTNELIINYLEEEITALRITVRRHGFYYQYYKEGLSDLDSLFFTRQKSEIKSTHQMLPGAANDYLDSIVYLFAIFKSAERLQTALQAEIKKYKVEQTSNNLLSTEKTSEFKWTGDVINIVEVAYGIWLTGQLNNGQAKLDQIVRWLETILQVKIGKVRNRFAEIERRKKLNTTRFLDEMKNSIIKKIENNNA